MTTLNINLPEPLKDFVENQAVKAGYSNLSEYLEDLIRKEQRRAAKQELEAQLLEGIHSGPSRKMTSEDWDRLRQHVRDYAQRRESK